jgi:hypothetical protein
MPAFLAALVGGLGLAVTSFVGRVLVALGVSYVTYTGLSAILTTVEAQVSSAFGALPAVAIAILGTLQLDTCVNIYLSAFAARLVIMGVGPTGAITRMILK